MSNGKTHLDDLDVLRPRTLVLHFAVKGTDHMAREVTTICGLRETHISWIYPNLHYSSEYGVMCEACLLVNMLRPDEALLFDPKDV